jgi:hypothetical protein
LFGVNFEAKTYLFISQPSEVVGLFSARALFFQDKTARRGEPAGLLFDARPPAQATSF